MLSGSMVNLDPYIRISPQKVSVTEQNIQIALGDDFSEVPVPAIILEVEGVLLPPLCVGRDLEPLQEILDFKKNNAGLKPNRISYSAAMTNFANFEVVGAAITDIVKTEPYGGLAIRPNKDNNKTNPYLVTIDVPDSIGMALLNEAPVYMNQTAHRNALEILKSSAQNKPKEPDFRIYG